MANGGYRDVSFHGQPAPPQNHTPKYNLSSLLFTGMKLNKFRNFGKYVSYIALPQRRNPPVCAATQRPCLRSPPARRTAIHSSIQTKTPQSSLPKPVRFLRPKFSRIVTVNFIDRYHRRGDYARSLCGLAGHQPLLSDLLARHRRDG